MISIRRVATAVAAAAIVAGSGAGIASATPTAEMPAHTWWGDSYCQWGRGFDWHYYNFCDRYMWHGSHYSDWNNHHRDNWNFDYDGFHGR